MALSREVGKGDAVTWLRHEPLGVQVYHVNGVFQETADHEIAVLRLGLFPEEQLEGLLQSEVASVQKGARYGIVFVRLHPGRADVIGATRYDDEFDVLLEEFARGLFGDVLDKDGMNLAHPLSGEALENEVSASILREVEEVYGLKRFGEMMTGVVHETIIPAIMKRRLRSMQWDVPPSPEPTAVQSTTHFFGTGAGTGCSAWASAYRNLARKTLASAFWLNR